MSSSPLAEQALAGHAHTPYFANASKHCALDTDVGVIVGGAMQMCAYPSSTCAVRAAIVTAIARGAKEIRGVAVDVGSGEESWPMCGCCVQFLSIFAPSECPVELVTSNQSTEAATTTSVSPSSPSKKRTTVAELTSSVRQFASPKPSSFLTKAWLKRNWFEELKIAPLGQKLPETYTPLPSYDSVSPEQLCELAVEACQKCYVPISSFPVGAAVLFKTKSSDQIMIATAGNVERDDGLHLGICAERSALAAAISMGGIREIKMLAVCCLKSIGIGSPCGMCRQSLVEFGDFPVLMSIVDPENRRITHQKTTSMQLLPDAFTPASLG